jgi:serine/threonine protein kinase
VTDVPGYHLDRLIGRRASGEVWPARQRSAGGRVVAVKCLATADGAAPREQLRVEGRVLAALDHPHIVTLYDVVDRPGGVALIMQYAGGGSLASLLGQRRLTTGQLVTVAAPLADAIACERALGHG